MTHGDPAGKYINLDEHARFVPTEALRDAYLRYCASRAPSTRPYVPLDEFGSAWGLDPGMAQGMELGMVASEAPAIAKAVSSVLSCSLEDAKYVNGGHLPSAVVERVQLEIISPHGVASLWGSFGHRFVLSRAVDHETSEILATILVARRKGTVFFFTGRYNNLRHSTMGTDVDFGQSVASTPAHKWFDQFAFPPVVQFKPKAYHQIANFVVAKAHRGAGLSRLLLDAIVKYYAKDQLDAHAEPIQHSQYLLCGRGFWQVGDPPWLTRMEKLGFSLRRGAESFFIEHDWAPLPPISANGRTISNLEYNRSFGLFDRYGAPAPSDPGPHDLPERIPEVLRLAADPRAKLQYFQTTFDFGPRQVLADRGSGRERAASSDHA